MFDYMRGYLSKDGDPIPKPSRAYSSPSETVAHTFPKSPLATQFRIPQRELNSISIDSRINEEVRAAEIRLLLPLLEGKETREVVETCEIPRYRTIIHRYPATTWEWIKKDINAFVRNIYVRLRNVRDSGWLFSRSQTTQVERWLKEFFLPCESWTEVIRHELIKKDKVERVVISKRYCPHHPCSASSRDCFTFLSCGEDASLDAQYLKASVATLKDILDALGNETVYRDILESIGRERFVAAIFYLDHIQKRHYK